MIGNFYVPTCMVDLPSHILLLTLFHQESAMYVCIIMEYYKLGDMDRVLKQKRRSKEHIEELVCKMLSCPTYVAIYAVCTFNTSQYNSSVL